MVFDKIVKGLKETPDDFSLYEALGDYYLDYNVNQAYLCYNHACAGHKKASVNKSLSDKIDLCRQQENFCVNPVSFVILSYNSKNIMEECLEAIRNTCDPGSYEIIIIDSSTETNVKDYLLQQKDIKLVFNDTFEGFASGCNQGAMLAKPGNDIMLLNNDAILTPHAMFYLQMGLYAEKAIGAVGPVGDYALSTGFFDKPVSLEKRLQLAKDINLPMKNPLERICWLSGYALLISRKVWDLIEGMDSRFAFGNYEDHDLILRINREKAATCLVHNAYIHHYGHLSMNQKTEQFSASMDENYRKLTSKWEFDWHKAVNWHPGIAGLIIPEIQARKDRLFKVLEINCGLGSTLNNIAFSCPNAQVFGIEENPSVAALCRHNINMTYGSLEDLPFSFEENTFDYIFMNEALERMSNPKSILLSLQKMLNIDGKLIICSKNAMNISVFSSLLDGRNIQNSLFHPEDLHRFTADDLTDLLGTIGYKPYLWTFIYDGIHNILTEEDEQLAQTLLEKSRKSRNDFQYSHILIASTK